MGLRCSPTGLKINDMTFLCLLCFNTWAAADQGCRLDYRKVQDEYLLLHKLIFFSFYHMLNIIRLNCLFAATSFHLTSC